jgi:hypothetical protein
MLYGARHQASILAADLRADDRQAADQARARSAMGAATTEATVRPSDEPQQAAANGRVHVPARVRLPLTLLGRPAR